MLEFVKSPWSGTGVLDFDRARRWFAKTYGWSQDVDTRYRILEESRKTIFVTEEDLNPHWAYSVQYQSYRIYVATEKELTMFILANPLKHD